MEVVHQNLGGAIKAEPIEIKPEPEDELVVETSATGPVSGSGGIKTEPTEIKSEPEVALRPKEPEIEAGNQSVSRALDDNDRPVMKYTLGESQSESESINLSTLYKSIKWTMVEEKDKPEVIKGPLSKCPTCGKRFRFESHLIRHVKSHKTIEDLMQTNEIYKCEQCQKMFRYKGAFFKHKICHNIKKEPPSKLQCDHCSYRCLRRQNLKHHIEKNHTPNAQHKDWNCPECDFTTKIMEELKEHRYRDHWRSYQCSICPYQTYQRAALSVHERTHEILQQEDKNFRLDKCDYGTNRLSSSLNTDSRTHPNPEEIEYFYCYHCSFKSKRKDYLQVHIRRHFEREQVEFECHICDFSTKKRQIYSCHIGEHNKRQKS